MADGKDLVVVDKKELALVKTKAKARAHDEKIADREGMWAILLPPAAAIAGAIALGPVGVWLVVPGILLGVGVGGFWNESAEPARDRLKKIYAEESAQLEAQKQAKKEAAAETQAQEAEKIQERLCRLQRMAREALKQAADAGTPVAVGTEFPVAIAGEDPKILCVTGITDEHMFDRDGQFVPARLMVAAATLHETELRADGHRVKGKSIADITQAVPRPPLFPPLTNYGSFPARPEKTPQAPTLSRPPVP